MAERLDDYDFDAFERPRTPPPPYPLDLWMDGSIWRIWQDEDFEGETRLMRSRLHYYAVSRRLSVTVRTVTDGKRHGLVFRFSARDFGHRLR
jgi:hypothetical protein